MAHISTYPREVEEALASLRGELSTLSASIAKTIKEAGPSSTCKRTDCGSLHCDNRVTLKTLAKSAKELEAVMATVAASDSWCCTSAGKTVADAVLSDVTRIRQHVKRVKAGVETVPIDSCVSGLAEEAGKLLEIAQVYKSVSKVFDCLGSSQVKEMLGKIDRVSETIAGLKELLSQRSAIDVLSESIGKLGYSISNSVPETEGSKMQALVDRCEKLNAVLSESARKVQLQCANLRELASQSYVVTDLGAKYDMLGSKAQEALDASEALERAAETAQRAKLAAEGVQKSLDAMDVRKLDKLLEQASAVGGLLNKKSELDGILESLSGLEKLMVKKDELYKLCAVINSIDKVKLDLLNVNPARLKSLTEQTVVVSQMTAAVATFNEEKLESIMNKYMQMHRFLGMASQLKLMADALSEIQPAKMAQMASSSTQLKEFLTDSTVSKMEKVMSIIDNTDVDKYSNLFAEDGLMADIARGYELIKGFASVMAGLDNKKLKLIGECGKK
ncbi:hypothetical protein LMBV_071 [Largemouth bass virus]|uniref:Uncharacterized protein n=1 Tax=Largemouth bass virus TaxID=176656 RepID=A0A9X7TWW7_9VIRU|nr:hypothetical protein OA88_23085 [Flavobacterium sp. JRM]QJE49133.1 hypothetical protein LMBV_070 [Largemouth bass virus]QJE49220.1 hypothetical protein LMBV_071 [Largemouth bass virus]